ncbi:glycerophosphodiester phosphodiesterase family protein [Maricaulis parjimensis]|uniref:glycerophosphodiester phosphodiesterase family protein n=1 Tax=Maricaulis parjimensis TaxID=144023 RepID=UPI001939808F|nr:glycerophosphodiester phosphodiesterase family protein [Maricaulis parjimensis]
MKQSTACLLLATALTACSPSAMPDPVDRAAPALALDCFREHGVAMLAAHRAGPASGYAENALSSLERLAGLGVLYAEIDVRQSADGELFLLHDETLDRTTTGAGPAETLSWAELSALYLRDPDGVILEDRIPTLSEAFLIARESGLVLNLDLKTIDADTIVTAIEAADARDLVAIIAYSVEDAAAIHALDPGLVLSAPDDPDALSAAGVNLDTTYLWLGTDPSEAIRDARFAGEDLETSIGLFRHEPGPTSLYTDARNAGVELLSIDHVEDAVAALGGPAVLHAQIDACAVANSEN